MNIAFDLAKKSKPYPNPRVGCVIVKDNKIFGQGHHKRAGLPHAEIEAISDAQIRGNDIKGADMFVTLEPCCFQGKTPACTNILLKSGIKRLFYSAVDSHPKVRGEGIRILKEAGIEVNQMLKEKGGAFYKQYFTFVNQQRPFVTIKVAMTLNGMITSDSEQGRYITCKESLVDVHKLRSQHDAVLVGIATILADNPMLNVRHVDGPDPIKVVLDSNARTPLDSNIFQGSRTIIFSKIHKTELSELSEQVIMPNISVQNVLQDLHTKNIQSVLIEGGQQIFTSFLNSGLFDELHVYMAPKTFKEGKIFTTAEVPLKIANIDVFGSDLKIIYKPLNT